MHDAEARALAHGQRVEPARLGIDEGVRADRDAEAALVTLHRTPQEGGELLALDGHVMARELVLDAGRAHVAEPALGSSASSSSLKMPRPGTSW